MRERFERLEEALQICRLMFTEPEPSFNGRHYRIEGAVNLPRPIQPGGPRILVGGSGERRTLRLVAQYADACNIFGDPDRIRHLNTVIDEHCADVGRDPSVITRTRLGSLAIFDTEADAAATRDLVVGVLGEADFAQRFVFGTAEQVSEKVTALSEAGLDELYFNLPLAQSAAEIERAGEVLAKLV